MMVDGAAYGSVLSPATDEQILLELSSGQHQCYLAVIPKEKDQESYQSNLLVGLHLHQKKKKKIVILSSSRKWRFSP